MNPAGTFWEFSRKNGEVIGHVMLNADGTIGCYHNFNERFWKVDGIYLYFLDAQKTVTTTFRSDPSSPDLVGKHNGIDGHHILKRLEASPNQEPLRPMPTKERPRFNFPDTAAFCLTVDGERRRQHHCLSEIRYMGFGEGYRVIGQPESKAPDGYAKACFYGSTKNHHEALMLMKQSKHQFAAIFEDDIIVLPAYDEKFTEIMNACHENDWHMLFFKNGLGAPTENMGVIDRMFGGTLTCPAYLVNNVDGIVDHLLWLTDTSLGNRTLGHSTFKNRFTVDEAYLYNLRGWNIFAAHEPLIVHDHKIFKQRSALEP